MPQTRQSKELKEEKDKQNKEVDHKELDYLLKNKRLCDLLILGNYVVSEKGSVENLEKGFKQVWDYVSPHLNNGDFNEIYKILGMANILMLRFEKAKDYFITANNNKKLRQLLELQLTYGRYDLLHDLIDYTRKNNRRGFSMPIDEYTNFIINRAIPHLRMEREGNTFYVDKKKLEQILDDYEKLLPKKIDRHEVVARVVERLEKAGNRNIPKRLFLARYSQDPWLIANTSEEFKKKLVPTRKRIDDIVGNYCRENNIRLIKKIQSGDYDDFFPISSHLYLAEENEKKNAEHRRKNRREKRRENRREDRGENRREDRGENRREDRGENRREERRKNRKIVLKENLKLYVDFSRLDGYNMEKEIYEKISKNPHKNIITYLGDVQTRGVEFLKFEFFQGEKLSNYTKKDNLLSLKESMRIVRELADVMNYLHSQNIIYSDIKDTNILYNPGTREIRLLDFGMSRLFKEKITENTYATSLLSTPKYVPPEMGTRFRFYKKSDVFQLGILFYELITGKHPFARYNLAEGEGDGLRESEIIKYSLSNICKEYDLSPGVLQNNNEINNLIARALEKDLEKRVTMNEFYNQLRAVEKKIADKHKT